MNDFSKTLKLLVEADKPANKVLTPNDNTSSGEIAGFTPKEKGPDKRSVTSSKKNVATSVSKLESAYKKIVGDMKTKLTEFTTKLEPYAKRAKAKTGAEILPGPSDAEIDAASGQASAEIQGKLDAIRGGVTKPQLSAFRGQRTKARNAAAAQAAQG